MARADRGWPRGLFVHIFWYFHSQKFPGRISLLQKVTQNALNKRANTIRPYIKLQK